MEFEKYEIGESVIYNADAFDVLPTLQDGIISHVCSDFPYGITNHSWDKVPPLDLTWKLLEAKAKDNANYVLFGAGGFTIDLINSKRDWYRYSMTWVKNNATMHLNANLMPMRKKEDVVVFGKPGHQKSAVFNVPDGFSQPSDVLVFSHERGNNQQGFNFHNTQKPLNLMGYLLMLYTNPGDLILDSFAGSGTTACAALRLGRRFIAIEKNREFYEIACRRLWDIHQRMNSRRRTTLMSFPSSPTDANQIDAEAVPAPESEQNFETTNLTENSICHVE